MMAALHTQNVLLINSNSLLETAPSVVHPHLLIS